MKKKIGNFSAWDEICYRWQIYTTVVKYQEDSQLNKNKKGKPSIIPGGSGALNNLTTVLGNPTGSGNTNDSANTSLYKLLLEKNAGSVLLEWTNLLGLLCSLSSIIFSYNPQSHNIGSRVTKATTSLNPNEFLNELMDLLVSEFINIREAVKMMLSTALNPSVYCFLFNCLLLECKKRLFQESGQIILTQDSILFADQCVSIVKLIIEGVSTDSEYVSLLTELEDLIYILIRFIRQLTINFNNLKIRLKVCSLIEAIMVKISILSFRNQYQFRTDMMENIMEWTSEFSTKESNIPVDILNNNTQYQQITKLIKELDVQIMQTIARLLKGCLLQGKDDEAKANLFSKLFTFFTVLLTRCKKNPNSVAPQLPEATIQSLSYLVTANIVCFLFINLFFSTQFNLLNIAFKTKFNSGNIRDTDWIIL